MHIRGLLVPALMWAAIYFIDGELSTPNFTFFTFTYCITFLVCRIFFGKMGLLTIIPEMIIMPAVIFAVHKIRYKVSLIITILFHLPFSISLYYLLKI